MQKEGECLGLPFPPFLLPMQKEGACPWDSLSLPYRVSHRPSGGGGNLAPWTMLFTDKL